MSLNHTLRTIGLSAVLAASLLPAAAMAQRDPAYAAARSAGQVGEKPDGYLHALGGGQPVKAMVDSLNIQRREVYTTRAKLESTTIDNIAWLAGCNNIKNTVAGEKYQAPDGSWQIRTAAPPIRDSRCP